MAGTKYRLEIKMDSDTVVRLGKGYTQFGLRTTASNTADSDPNRAAAVWLINDSYGATTAVDWTTQYGLWTGTHQQLDTGQQITTSNKYIDNVDLGDLFTITDRSGIGELEKGGGEKGCVTIYNSVPSTMLSSGLLMNNTHNPSTSEDDFAETCIFDTPGRQALVMEPIQKILFFFATNRWKSNTVVRKAVTDAVLVDFTGSNTQRQISYGFTTGWKPQAFTPEVFSNAAELGCGGMGFQPVSPHPSR
jgi:hypothetical protein